MNRFKIILGEENAFEEIWKNRETHLDKVKGEKTEEYFLYALHTIWDAREDFVNWTKSEEFRLAHKGAGGNKSVYLEHPKFEGFEKVL